MKPKTRQRTAEILAEFLSLPVPRKEAPGIICEKYGISRRTLNRMLTAYEKDEPLKRAVAELRAPTVEAWEAKLAEAKIRILNSGLKSVDEMDSKSPEALRAKAEFLRTVTETERADSVARAYIHQTTQPAQSGAGQVGPRVQLIGDAEFCEADDSVPEAEQAAEGSVEAPGQADPSGSAVRALP